MHRGSRRNNVLAGLFLLIALLGGIVISVVLSDISFASQTPYVVRLPLEVGATGIKPGAPVRIGGQDVGKVVKVEFGFAESSDRAVGVDVRIRIRSDVALYDDTVAMLEMPLLGSLSAINFASVGGLSSGAARVPARGIIPGMLSPPAFLAQAGFGPEERRRVSSILRGMEDATLKANEILDRVGPQLDPAIEDVRGAIADVRQITSRLQEQMDPWVGSFDRTLANAERFSQDLQPGMDELRGAISEARAGVEDGRRVITSVQEAIDANRPGVDDIVANVRDATETLNRDTIPEYTRLASAAQEEIDQWGSLFDRVDAFLAQELPTLRRGLANAAIATGQLKLAMAEIRAQPWRLLIRPNTKELENELLYDSARTYAEAVSDLRAASEAIEASTSGVIPAGLSPEDMRALSDRLNDAFARYERAERDLLQRLVDRGE
ncbi:MAG: MCE family protein [Phycisphaeraceae bacterium]|nr:MCE family protein [Phycisphaeraceae bacterium]